MLGRKSLAASFLVMLIITIISFMLIAGTVARFLSDADEKEAEVLCQSSIGLRARTAVSFSQEVLSVEAARGQLRAVPPLCKTIDKKVSGDREHIKKQIADKMARCWWMFGEGRYEEVLKGSSLEILPAVFGFENTEKECFNCYTMLIDEEEIPGGPIAGEEMVRYLSTTKYPRAGKDVTYLQYIQSFGGSGRVAITAPPGIIAGEAYSISFLPKNKEVDEGTFWKGAAQVAVGAITVAAIGVGAICIASTAGICTAVVGPLAGIASANTAMGLGILAAPKTAALIAGGAAYVTYAGYNNAMAAMYEERDISSIYMGFTQTAQEMCGGKDIAGE